MLVEDRLVDITNILGESFTEDALDGFWYPSEAGSPLVRIQVAASGYEIQRRRNSKSPWLPVVSANAAEFDVHAFRAWRAHWTMVEPLA